MQDVAWSSSKKIPVEVQSDPTLKLGELLGQEPYATNRLRQLETFAASPLFKDWRARLTAAGEHTSERVAPAGSALERGAAVEKNALAGNSLFPKERTQRYVRFTVGDWRQQKR